MTRVPFTNTWIESGKILIGSILQLPEDAKALQAMGIKPVCSLTRRDPLSYPDMPGFADTGLVYWHFPIPDGGIASENVMFNAIAYINAHYVRGNPLYVHCRGGIGRSGAILQAYYIIYRGMTADQARDQVRVRRNFEGNATAADQGSPQREWVDLVAMRRDQILEINKGLFA